MEKIENQKFNGEDLFYALREKDPQLDSIKLPELKTPLKKKAFLGNFFTRHYRLFTIVIAFVMLTAGILGGLAYLNKPNQGNNLKLIQQIKATNAEILLNLQQQLTNPRWINLPDINETQIVMSANVVATNPGLCNGFSVIQDMQFSYNRTIQAQDSYTNKSYYYEDTLPSGEIINRVMFDGASQLFINHNGKYTVVKNDTGYDNPDSKLRFIATDNNGYPDIPMTVADTVTSNGKTNYLVQFDVDTFPCSLSQNDSVRYLYSSGGFDSGPLTMIRAQAEVDSQNFRINSISFYKETIKPENLIGTMSSTITIGTNLFYFQDIQANTNWGTLKYLSSYDLTTTNLALPEVVIRPATTNDTGEGYSTDPNYVSPWEINDKLLNSSDFYSTSSFGQNFYENNVKIAAGISNLISTNPLKSQSLYYVKYQDSNNNMWTFDVYSGTVTPRDFNNSMQGVNKDKNVPFLSKDIEVTLNGAKVKAVMITDDMSSPLNSNYGDAASSQVLFSYKGDTYVIWVVNVMETRDVLTNNPNYADYLQFTLAK